ncbi:MAG: GH92 family glycosyl hydrolase, partial [Bacteroidales bacterium]|nr:GH92 family glycosyl hydrolase [Bacteroidales bacterium]
GGHGHTYPGATLPFGMVQLSPDTRIDSWDGCSGYHYSDSTILGFSHTHLSGTGVGDYGDFRFMPTVGEVKLIPGDENNPQSGYRSSFNHKTENASPGYYAVSLDDYQVDVELTTTKRAGFHKYTFPETDQANVIIDLTEGITSDKILCLEFQFLSDRTCAGIRRTKGWANDQQTYFYAEFSKPFKNFALLDDVGLHRKSYINQYGNNIKAFVSFDAEENEEIFVKVGLSSVDIPGAKKNLKAEIPNWDFDKVKDHAEKTWNQQLSKIKVEGGTDDQKTVFYSALYHAFLAPNIFNDVDGKYRAHDGKRYQNKKSDIYTVFSLWDTFRAEHPLFTLVEQDRTNDFINSMIDMYQKGGLLPVWELAGNETNCMIGYHSIPVIVDAYKKGIRDYDVNEAFPAMIRSATEDHFGLEYYRKYGYIPADKEGASVSRTLEYAYDDWCIAEMAKELGDEKVYKNYIKRAQNFKNIFDKETGFMRGKRNGCFVNPFDPTEVNFMLTEANTWQYNFFVPQDISGLINLLGGKEKFSAKLGELFSTEAKLSGRHQSDITGLIGQYAHGNEPSHNMAYLFNYVGEAWKTQKIVRQILDELYTSNPDGYCGNEDCGQMSAWYVLSAMGFYPVCPGDNTYVIGTPLFDKVTLNLENGKTFIIEAKNVSNENIYIQSAVLNNQEYSKSFILHDDIINGGSLVFEMGPEPNKNWGSAENDIPVSAINDELITVVPYFVSSANVFTGSTEVKIKHIDDNVEIYFTTNGDVPDKNSKRYSDLIKIRKSTSFKAIAYLNGKTSKIVSSEFIKIPQGRVIKIINKYDSQYTAGGDIALIDYQRGGKNFTTGAWQGYYGVDMEVVIDLGKIQKVNSLSTGFLQDQNSWIFMPERIDYLISVNRKDFDFVGSVKNYISQKEDGGITQDLTLKRINKKARYIKVTAKNMGNCPDWHKGAGGKTWIFADEIVIE